MQDVFNQTLTLFTVMIIGLIAAKIDIFTHEVRRKLSVLLINITAPLLILKNFQIDYSKKLLTNMGIMAIFAIVLIGAGIIVGKYVWKKMPDDRKPILHFATAFPNCGFLGYPVLGGLFGSEAIIYVAIVVMIFNIYIWTLGIKIFSGKSEKWYKPFTRPAIIAIVLGLFMFTFSLRMPIPLYNATAMVGSMTSPIAMLLVGSYLADSKIKEIFCNKHIYFLSIFRFAIWPTITFFALRPFNLSEIVYASCVLISAMPAAANTVILATRYDKNPEFASELVALTTLISLALIPVWMYFITL